jgi:K+-sensing histidine kinase KdpD
MEDMLLVSRFEEGSVALKSGDVDLAEILAGVRAEKERLAKHIGVTLEMSVASVPFRGDDAMFRRVAANLFDFALRRVERPGRVFVRLEREKDQLVLRVSHGGRAVPAADRAQLFDRFDRARLGPQASAVLGLYCCRLVIEAHGGKIGIEDDADWAVSIVARLRAG